LAEKERLAVIKISGKGDFTSTSLRMVSLSNHKFFFGDFR